RRGGKYDGRCWQAEAHLSAGNLGAYGRACARLLDEVGAVGDPAVAYRVARACVLAPAREADRARGVGLAETALAGAGRFRIFPDSSRDHEEECREILALALYRAGKFEVVIRRLQEAMPRRGPSEQAPLNWYFLPAMAHHRLGQSDRAQP